MESYIILLFNVGIIVVYVFKYYILIFDIISLEHKIKMLIAQNVLKVHKIDYILIYYCIWISIKYNET